MNLYIHPYSMYRVLINYCVFSLKFRNFSELFQLCCSASVLPAWCVYTHWHQGKQRKARVRKNTIFNEHPVYIVLLPTTKSTYTTRANNAQWRAKQNQTTTTYQIDQTAYRQEWSLYIGYFVRLSAMFFSLYYTIKKTLFVGFDLVHKLTSSLTPWVCLSVCLSVWNLNPS